MSKRLHFTAQQTYRSGRQCCTQKTSFHTMKTIGQYFCSVRWRQNGEGSDLGSLLSLLGFAVMKMGCVWMGTTCRTHLTRPDFWLSRSGRFFGSHIFVVTSDLKTDSLLPSNFRTGEKFSSTRGCLSPARHPIVEYLEWEGPIFLPNKRGKFFAVLAGEADLYPFSSKTDRFEIKPSARHQIFQQLIDSDFVGSVWSLRRNSRHAKSKTYKRDFE